MDSDFDTNTGVEEMKESSTPMNSSSDNSIRKSYSQSLKTAVRQMMIPLTETEISLVLEERSIAVDGMSKNKDHLERNKSYEDITNNIISIIKEIEFKYEKLKYAYHFFNNKLPLDSLKIDKDTDLVVVESLIEDIEKTAQDNNLEDYLKVLEKLIQKYLIFLDQTDYLLKLCSYTGDLRGNIEKLAKESEDESIEGVKNISVELTNAYNNLFEGLYNQTEVNEVPVQPDLEYTFQKNNVCYIKK